jgi:YggT family protein
MGNPYVGNAATFLITTAFGLYILIVMLRFVLQIVHADFYNPMSQFIVKATDPVLRPLRRYVPGAGGIDLASVIVMIVLKYVELALTAWIVGHSPHFAGVLMLSIAQLLSLLVNVFFFAIIIQVILSWVNPGNYNPVIALVYSLTEPLLGPARRVIPPMGGLDLSPIVVIVALKLVDLLFIAPIMDTARNML